jgi:SAM-dependent methyltransferase
VFKEAANMVESATTPSEGILALYTDLALHPGKDFGWNKGRENARRLGYDPRWLDSLPDLLWESAAAVGNPFAARPLRAGDVVLDLGCGAGADSCIAALSVGAEGRVIGVDLTPAMIEKARRVADAIGLTNVVFHVSDMDAVPVSDDSVDVVISNGAINLTAHKPCVFREAHRVLKPGGRLQFADMVRIAPAGSDAGASWADCVAGAVEPETYLEMLRAEGFEQAELVAFTGYKTAIETSGAIFHASKGI